MREPYLLTFSSFALSGFVNILIAGARLAVNSKLPDSEMAGFGLGLACWVCCLFPLLVALMTIVIFAGWIFFANENRQISWKAIVAVAVVFILGLFLFSSSLNRSGQFNATSPLHVINDWLQLAVKWDMYQLERDSGWVQKIFDEDPEWMRLPFIGNIWNPSTSFAGNGHSPDKINLGGHRISACVGLVSCFRC